MGNFQLNLYKKNKNHEIEGRKKTKTKLVNISKIWNKDIGFADLIETFRNACKDELSKLKDCSTEAIIKRYARTYKICLSFAWDLPKLFLRYGLFGFVRR